MNEVTACFGANLKALRTAAGLSQEALADRAAIHRTQIWKFESGRCGPQLEGLMKLAGALGTDSNDLLKGTRWVPITPSRGAFVRGEFVRDPEDGADDQG